MPAADVVEADTAAMPVDRAAEADEGAVIHPLPIEEDIIALYLCGVGIEGSKRVAEESARGFVEEAVAWAEAKKDSTGRFKWSWGAEDVSAEVKACCPERLDARAREQVQHALVFAAAFESAVVVRCRRVTVFRVGRAVQKFAPGLLFCGVGERGANRLPDGFPGDGQAGQPRVLQAASQLGLASVYLTPLISICRVKYLVRLWMERSERRRRSSPNSSGDFFRGGSSWRCHPSLSGKADETGKLIGLIISAVPSSASSSPAYGLL